MHYASKNNATLSLKVMLRLGGRINDRDYKRRTPLFVAAETGKNFFVIKIYPKYPIALKEIITGATFRNCTMSKSYRVVTAVVREKIRLKF